MFLPRNIAATHKELFRNVDCRVDREYNAKSFLNSMCDQGYFIECIQSIVMRQGFVVNEQYCLFPDFEIEEPSSHFEGVKFALFDNELIISENECASLVDKACAEYLKLHPEDSVKIRNILQSRLF